MKRFFKIFLLLLVAEILLAMGAVFLQNLYNSTADFAGNLIMKIISFPASLIDPLYPYYSPDAWYVTLSVLLLNIVVHTIILLAIVKSKK